MPEIILPKTSSEIARNTFQEYVNSPTKFLRNVVTSLQEENPVFLDANLRGAVDFAIAGYRKDAQQLISGNFYRYECTVREIKKQGVEVPFIGKGAIQRTLEEVAMLTGGVLEAGGDAKAAVRQRVMRIERDDPEVGSIANQLLSINMDAFIEGAHTAHLNFIFLDESESKQANLFPEPAQSSIFPTVRRSIVRSALLEIILDPEEFAIRVFEDAQKVIPSIAARVIRIARRPTDYYNDIYGLFSSFTINGIVQEFSQRGEQFPTILEEDPSSHPDSAINKAMKENPAEANRLIREYNLSILDEIRNTNPHLYWGLDALLNPLFRMTGSEAIIALNGIVNPYSSLKVGLS